MEKAKSPADNPIQLHKVGIKLLTLLKNKGEDIKVESFPCSRLARGLPKQRITA